MKRILLILLFLLILLSGNSWSNSISQRSELNSTRETSSSVPTVTKAVDSKTYTNDKFGFAIKLADDLGLLEQKPEPSDSFLTKVYTPHNRGSFASEVLVYKNKNTTPLITHNQIHEIINKWYGYPEGTELPFQDANEEQYFINGTPAIKVDYIEHSEDLSRILPASIVFTANEFFVYRIACCCDRGRCNEIIRSFELVGIDWGKHVVKEEHFDSPSLVKLKVLHPTAATISGQKEVAGFVWTA